MNKLKQVIREELAALLDEEKPDAFEKIIGPDPNKPKKSYPAKLVKKKKKPARVHPDGTPYEETGGCPDDGAGDPAHCYESMQFLCPCDATVSFSDFKVTTTMLMDGSNPDAKTRVLFKHNSNIPKGSFISISIWFSPMACVNAVSNTPSMST